ncbi:MAG: aldo/keto reductase, partial [Boseongicola sp.]|nr:aldo/keto reductase [Boseongicola sp.]
PEGSRMSIGNSMGGRNGPRVAEAVEIYAAIAEKYGVDFTHMALQWCRTRPFPTIPIFGATTTEQLAHILKAPGVTLPEELLSEVSKAHRSFPMPY